MKKLFFAVLAFSLVAIVCCQDENALNKEKRAIKAVIESERSAYYKQDLNGLDDAWSQETSSRKLFMTPVGITELEGWESIHQNNVEAAEREWDESSETAQYSNYTINIYGNTALVLHDSDHRMNVQDEENNLKMRRILHLVKVEDDWKIDFMAMYFLPQALMGEETEQ